jgi:ketosteroid isomerase-like protein
MLRCSSTVTAGVLAIALAGCQAPGHRADAERAVQQTLADQAGAWNRGDIAGYMQAYWNSEELSFSSGGKTTYGYAATKAAYERRYPSPERMGRLTFSELHVRMLGSAAALVLGRWQLDRDPDPIGGNFTLVLQMTDGQWRIVHDHTSQLRE